MSFSKVVSGVMGEGDGAADALVESRPWRLRSKWPIAVATVLGLCLQSKADVSRGSVDRYPLCSARRKVDMEGLPNDA